MGMVLILGILIFSILRAYFPSLRATILLEGLFVGGVSSIFPQLALAYCIPIFEGSLAKKSLWTLPGLLVGILGWEFSSTLILLFIIGWFLGRVFRVAKEERDYYKEETDFERRGRYEAEGLNRDLLFLQEEVLRMAELAERNRIAQQLHDDVGHELTGAVLGLQAFESMLEDRELEPHQQEIFDKVKERVNTGATVLRQTVHNMKPYVPLGVDDLRGIAEDFRDLPIEFKAFGNTEQVPVHHWVLLRTAFKEGLTNIVRHAQATKVKAQLDITPNILRFSLENDGVGGENNRIGTKAPVLEEGIGLKSLRQRTKSYGGNFSATVMNGDDLFRLVIVLPLDEGGAS